MPPTESRFISSYLLTTLRSFPSMLSSCPTTPPVHGGYHLDDSSAREPDCLSDQSATLDHANQDHHDRQYEQDVDIPSHRGRRDETESPQNQ
jgi:hypothetical protein